MSQEAATRGVHKDVFIRDGDVVALVTAGCGQLGETRPEKRRHVDAVA